MSDQLRFLLDHPLFVHGAAWQAEGWYVEEHGALLSAAGVTEIERGDEHWTVSAELRITLVDQPDMVFHNAYAFEPPEADTREVYWTSVNPFLGSMAGRFTVVADSIQSLGFAEDGHHIIHETYMLTEDDTYEVRGALSRDGETVGSWAVTLEPLEVDGLG